MKERDREEEGETEEGARKEIKEKMSRSRITKLTGTDGWRSNIPN